MSSSVSISTRSDAPEPRLSPQQQNCKFAFLFGQDGLRKLTLARQSALEQELEPHFLSCSTCRQGLQMIHKLICNKS